MATMTQKRKFLTVRIDSGIDTQEALAAAARVDQTTISKIERGKKPITEKTAWKLFFALNTARKTRQLPALTFDEIDFCLIE
jgi:transcriptional regulator with XRE-family HTH domain